MSEIKTSYTKEQIEEYLKENNLDVLNSFQIWAKLMEIEHKLSMIANVVVPTPLNTANEDNN